MPHKLNIYLPLIKCIKKITFQLAKDIRIYFLHTVCDPQHDIVIDTGYKYKTY